MTIRITARFGRPAPHLRKTVLNLREFWAKAGTGAPIDLPAGRAATPQNRPGNAPKTFASTLSCPHCERSTPMAGGLSLVDYFATFATRWQHRDQLLAVLNEVLATWTVAQWLEPLQTASIPSAPIRNVAEALTDPHTRARGLVIETEHPVLGRVRSVASPVRVGEQPPGYRRAPLHGEALLRDLLGYHEARIKELERAAAFGTAPRSDGVEPEAAAR